MSSSIEQDKELRKKISKMCEGIAAGYHGEDGIDYIMQLITADRKRVALEARIETVMSIDAMLRFENIPLHPVQAESLKQYLRQLEAQQEEV